MKKKISYSSILIGLLTFGLLGFAIFNQLTRLEVLQTSSLKYLFIGVGALLGGLFGYRKPVATELWSFALTGIIFVQVWWDTSYDISGLNDPRVFTGAIALGIFLLNSFTGKKRLKKAKKQLRKLAGR